jgi:hypothetical protein
MKVRMFNDIWKQDNFDVTNKKIDVWYFQNSKWNNMHVSITTNDGVVQTGKDGKWELPTIPVNMKQLRERVKLFLNSDLPCFDDIYKRHFLITMRNDWNDTDFVELSEWW